MSTASDIRAREIPDNRANPTEVDVRRGGGALGRRKPTSRPLNKERSPVPCGQKRAFLHPFLLDREAGGGMASVFHAIMAERKRFAVMGRGIPDALQVLSLDKSSFEIADLRVRFLPAAAPLPKDFYQYIYDDVPWYVLLHSNCVTRRGQTLDALRRMFKMRCEGTVGELAFANRYFERYGAKTSSPEIDREITEIFGRNLEALEPESIMHWSMHTALPVMERYADLLRGRGVYQTYHHHFPLPDDLYQHAAGRAMLVTLCAIDAVYFHTDEDITNFEAQIGQMDLPPPLVARFRLGIDPMTLEKDADRITRDTYRRELSHHTLSKEQWAALDEIARTEDVIPDQFINIDRVDPHKGNTQLLDGIHAYLDGLGLSQEGIRKRFRFYFFNELLYFERYDDHRPRHQYALYTQEKYHALQSKYPGVFFIAEHIPKEAIPFVLRKKTLLNFSVHEGKHLSCMEAAHINSLDDRADVPIIVGRGAGFPKQTIRDGHGDLALFPEPGDPRNMAEALRESVRIRRDHPGYWRQRTRRLAREVIAPQHDSVFPDAA